MITEQSINEFIQKPNQVWSLSSWDDTAHCVLKAHGMELTSNQYLPFDWLRWFVDKQPQIDQDAAVKLRQLGQRIAANYLRDYAMNQWSK